MATSIKCIATTKSGKPCKNGQKVGQYCNVHKDKNNTLKPTITITFGDVCENHAGMQKLGVDATAGFSKADLDQAHRYFHEKGCVTEMYHLNGLLPVTEKAEDAYILVIRNATSILVPEGGIMEEQTKLVWDTKAKMRGKVVNKIARHNLCYGPTNQQADFENGKGTVIAFSDLPCLNSIRQQLPVILGEKARDLMAEGNMYYDASKCGIGAHGDSERRLVVAIRLGESMALQFHWFHRSAMVGNCFHTVLNNGDMYIMSEKAVGTDWKKSSILTLRHAAGAKKYLFK